MPAIRNFTTRWRPNTMLIAASLFVFMLVIWKGRPQFESAPPPVATRVAAPAMAPPPAQQIQPSADPRVSTQGTNASVSEDALRLQLFRTFPGRNAREGTAVLGTSAENPQTYAAGAMLASGARIEEIHRDHVVLRHGGRFMKLYVVGSGKAQDDGLSAATTVGGPEFTERTVERRPNSREDYAEFIRPKLVFDDAGEKIAGFKIVAGRNRGQLTRLGLVPGDVIRSIDGRPVQADADWRRISDAFASGSSLSLVVERDGSLVPLLMDAKQLNAGTNVAGVDPPMPPPT